MKRSHPPPYRYEATSLGGFLQQLAVALLGRGYWFYVTGRIPETKDPRRTDEKLLERYGIRMSRWARVRRKRAGLSNLHYLRFGRFFVLVATQGEHRFFVEEGKRVRDARRDSLRVLDYSVGVKRGADGRLHPSVRIHPAVYRDLKARFLEVAARRDAETLAAMFRSLPYERYAPVRRQLAALLRHVNRARRTAGLPPVGNACLRKSRHSVRVFAEVNESEPKAA